MFPFHRVLSCPFSGPALLASHLAGRPKSETLCGRAGVSEIGHVWRVSCCHEP